MFTKTVLSVCAQALLIQSISAQCIGALGAYDGFGCGTYGYNGLAYEGLGLGTCAGPYGFNPARLAASNGPGLAVTSVSPLIPAGVSVIAETGYEGALAVGGAIPFLGTVAVKGALPTVGAGATAYSCGNGAVDITTEDIVTYSFVDIDEPLGYGYGLAGPLGYGGIAEPLGYGYGLAGPLGYRAGCGCGALY